jgi:hypothetical protein
MAIFASYNIDWEEEEKPPGPSSQVTGKLDDQLVFFYTG